jgi:hypothetical protein
MMPGQQGGQPGQPGQQWQQQQQRFPMGQQSPQQQLEENLDTLTNGLNLDATDTPLMPLMYRDYLEKTGQVLFLKGCNFAAFREGTKMGCCTKVRVFIV